MRMLWKFICLLLALCVNFKYRNACEEFSTYGIGFLVVYFSIQWTIPIELFVSSSFVYAALAVLFWLVDSVGSC